MDPFQQSSVPQNFQKLAFSSEVTMRHTITWVDNLKLQKIKRKPTNLKLNLDLESQKCIFMMQFE